VTGGKVYQIPDTKDKALVAHAGHTEGRHGYRVENRNAEGTAEVATQKRAWCDVKRPTLLYNYL
jgi:hypothetical protein